MRPTWRGLILLWALLVPAGMADAADYYMAPSGSDTAEGTLAKPWASYRRAQAALRPGDTLYARGGTYGPSAGRGRDWSASGAAGAPITFSAYQGEKPIFDGQWATGAFLIFQTSSWVVVNGLQMQHYNDNSGNGTVLIYEKATNIVIQNNHFKDNGKTTQTDHHIYLNSGSSRDITISGNIFEGSPGAGIHFYHPPTPQRVKIFNNFFKNNYWGIIIAHEAADVSIYDNTFYNNTINIDLADRGTVPLRNISIWNNISYSGTGRGIVIGTRNAPAVTGDYNLWYGPGAPPNMGLHSLKVDPQFVTAGGYELKETSPAIGAGSPTLSAATDIVGTRRPQGTAFDMGAQEVALAEPEPPIPPIPPVTTVQWWCALTPEKNLIPWMCASDSERVEADIKEAGLQWQSVPVTVAPSQ